MAKASTVGGLPPHNREMEQAVIGCLLIDQEAILAVAALLAPEDLYLEANSKIYQTILELHNAGKVADVLTVSHSLQEHGMLEAVGNLGYLTKCIATPPTPAYASHYALMVRELSQRRKLIELGGKVAQTGYESNASADVLAREAFREFGDIMASGKNDIIYTPDMMQELPRVNFLIDGGILPENGRFCIYGPPKGGKTRLVIELACALATNDPWLGRFPTYAKHTILIVERDMPFNAFSTWLLKSRANFPNGLESKTNAADGWGLDIATPEGLARLSQMVSRAQADILILDSLRSLSSAKENESDEQRAMYRGLDTIMAQHALKAIGVVHHTRKLGPNEKLIPEHARGSGDLAAWVESMIGLDGREKKKDARLTFLCRHGAPEDLALTYDEDTGHYSARDFESEDDTPFRWAKVLLETNGGKMASSSFVQAMKESGAYSDRIARTTIKKLANQGAIELIPSRQFNPRARAHALHLVVKDDQKFMPLERSEPNAIIF